MSWKITGVREDTDRFDGLEPVHILYELDTPKIFTAVLDVVPVLVYESFVDVEKRLVFLIVTPTSNGVIAALKDGVKTVLQALDQPWVWIVTQNFDGKTLEVVLLDDGIRSVPVGYKPKPAAMLWPELMPLVSVRLIGDGLREGHVPASVIKRAADGIPAALKKCFEEALGTRAQGRPDEAVRTLYDLEAQQMAFNSFEISFRAPAQSPLPLGQDPEVDPYLEQGVALRNAIGWALDEVGTETPSIELAEALEKLVPPMHGIVEQVEVKGRIFRQSQSFFLDRTTTKKVKRYLTEQRAAIRSLVTVEGLIEELDKGRLTFILRSTHDGKDKNFTFSEEFLDDVITAFNSEVRVNVSGKQTSTKQIIEMLGLDFLHTPQVDT